MGGDPYVLSEVEMEVEMDMGSEWACIVVM
jgi:hypothetical protein